MGINGIGSEAWRLAGSSSLSGMGSSSAAGGSSMSALSGIQDATGASQAAEAALDGAADSSFASSLRKAYDEGDKKELKTVCEQFESIMMSMMYKQMKSTVPDSSFIERSQGMDIFEDMLDDELMSRASNRGLGLADLMYRQLSRQMDRVYVADGASGKTGAPGAASGTDPGASSDAAGAAQGGSAAQGGDGGVTE